MKLKLILTTAIVGAALALPNVSSAAPPPPPPTQDSVVLTGPGEVIDLTGPVRFDIQVINATSGPSGEDPVGQVRFDVFVLVDPKAPPVEYRVGGPVTCLAVSGNSATLNFQDQMDLAGTIISVGVVDDQPDSFHSQPIGRAATDCSPLPPTLTGGPMDVGSVAVVDAQPPPTTKAQCMNGGWQQFGFANQGLCLAFVSRS